MQVMTTVLPGVLILAPKVFADARGFFLESFSQRRFDEVIGERVAFVQDNHSRSTRGVLRGLHLQKPPHAQGKLVRVASGRVFDVAVDIDPSSATYRRWVGVELDDVLHRQMWTPGHYAHGFLVLSHSADRLGEATLVEALEEKAARVGEHLGRDDQHAWQQGGRDLHQNTRLSATWRR